MQCCANDSTAQLSTPYRPEKNVMNIVEAWTLLHEGHATVTGTVFAYLTHLRYYLVNIPPGEIVNTSLTRVKVPL